MNKKFLSVMLLATFFLGGASLFTACSDDDTVYDDTSVTSQISSLTTQLATLQSALSEVQSTAESAASTAASAAATAKAEAIEEAIAQTKALIAEQSSATDEEIAALSLLIEGIDSDLNELSSSLSSVSEDVEANTTAVVALQVQMDAVEEYMETTDDAIETLEEVVSDIQDDLETLTGVVDGKCTMAEVESYIAQVLSGNTQAVYTKDEVDALLSDITDQILDINAALLTLKTDKLTSLVFIPELYVNGIEATRYVYATGITSTENPTQTSGTTYEGYDYAFPDGAPNEYAYNRMASYTITPTAKMSYHYNPSSAVLDGVTFDFDELDVESITRATASWSASCNSIAYKNGTLDVYYSIDNPTALADPAAIDSVPVMSLKATLANDTTVNSDYAAIVPAVRSLNYIAFTAASSYTALGNNCNDDYDLYLDGSAAAENAASIGWAYNGGTLDLASLLCLHYAQADYGDWQSSMYNCDEVMTIDDLEAWGLSLEFEALPYLVGANQTDQSAYCFVTEEGEFTPAYIPVGGTVDNKTAIEEGSTTGQSSIGRTPIVLVKLVDANDNVLAYGYIKIEITQVTTSPTTNNQGIEVESQTIAYDCDPETITIKWDNVSANIYQFVNMSADSFRSTYTAQTGSTYIKNASGEFETSTDYGTIAETGDNAGNTTTTVLTATVTADQKANIYADCTDHTQTIYLKYSNASGTSNIYVGFTITIAELPSVTFTEIIGSQWVNPGKDGALENGYETKWNVPAPTNNGDAVTEYKKTLNELFYNQQIVATLGGDNASLYDATAVSYKYSFDATQDNIGSYTLSVSDDGTILYANSTNILATITTPATGEIKYADNDVAKEILNLYSHDNSTLAYAKILVTATYGTCTLPLETRYFYLDFIRPIDIEAGSDAVFTDATANGYTVSMAKLITITDWRDKTVYPDGTDNGVNLYDYYKFKTITIDLDNALYNGTAHKVSETSIDLSLVDASGNKLSSNTVSIASATDLSGIYIKQSNNSTIASTYTLQIPIKVTYAWGTLSYTVNATVNHTIANSKAN